MPDTTSAFLQIDSLEKRWPNKEVLLSVTATKGEALALLGPSGCGKSTVLRMIAGLEAPDSGCVLIGGRDISSLPPGKRQIGFVFQESALFPHLSVQDNIGYGLVSGGMSLRESRRHAVQWLERFSLSGFAKRKPETLSGGEKQRVSLARTLAVEPLLVLFDEPLSALDTDLRKRLRQELRSRQQEFAYTAIYVTHDEEEAAVLADRIVRMV